MMASHELLARNDNSFMGLAQYAAWVNSGAFGADIQEELLEESMYQLAQKIMYADAAHGDSRYVVAFMSGEAAQTLWKNNVTDFYNSAKDESINMAGGSNLSLSYNENNRPQIGDIYYDIFVPHEMLSQGNYKNMCTPTIMEFAGQNIGDKVGYDRADIALVISKAFNFDVSRVGVPSNVLDPIVNAFFVHPDFTSYQAAILASQPVLTFFITGEKVGHAVLIVGMNLFSNTFIYMDPQLGTLQYGAPANMFLPQYSYPLTNNKYYPNQ